MEKQKWEKAILTLLFIPTVIAGLLLPIIMLILILQSSPIFEDRSILQVVFGRTWLPSSGEVGMFPFIAGTLSVTSLSMLFAVPTGLLSAVFLAEYASPLTRRMIKPWFDLMAGIPSVIFGLFGVLTIVPLVRDVIAPVFGVGATGYCLLSGSFILALMLLPTLVSLGDEVLRGVPREIKLASYVLGATRWETFWHVTLIKALPGICGVIILALSRAIGETMAVLMVVGNVPEVPSSVFDPAYPLPALIANNYGEIMSIPDLQAAMMTAALILLIIILGFHLIFRGFISRVHEPGV